jgi:hypothetical protein
MTEFSEIDRGTEREIGKEEGQVLPRRAACRGRKFSPGAPLQCPECNLIGLLTYLMLRTQEIRR